MGQGVDPDIYYADSGSVPRPNSKSTERDQGGETNRVTIAAGRWSGGWELWNEDDCWTQVRYLKNAIQQVHDYVDTMWPEVDHSGVDVVILPSAELGDDAVIACDAARVARESSALAAAASRKAAASPIAQGVSTTDTAVLMGVSKGRVSHLVGR